MRKRPDAAEVPDAGPGADAFEPVDVGPLPDAAEPPARWDERAPSSIGAYLTTEDRAQFAQGIADRVRLQNGLFLGRAPIPAPGTDPSTQPEVAPAAPLAEPKAAAVEERREAPPAEKPPVARPAARKKSPKAKW